MSHAPDPNQRTSHYPILLDLTDRPVTVVGGGVMAEHKTAGLLAAGAEVTVIAPRLTATLVDWSDAGRITWTRRRYRPGDLEGAFVVVAATDSNDVTQAVWEEAEARQTPLNAVDDPPRCSFILPAIHRDGELTVAVSTGGRAPALAVRLRDRIVGIVGTGYAEHLELLGSLRATIADRFDTFSERRTVWYELVDSDILDLVRRGDMPGARRRASAIVDRAAGVEGAA